MGIMETISDDQAHKPFVLITAVTVLAIAYFIGNIIYTLFFSDLARVPGPWINKVSRIPYILHLRNGTTVKNTQALHARYGPVVQISPADISFTSIDTAWPQVYGFRTGKLKGHASHPKDNAWLGPKAFGADSVLRAHGEDHGRQRKLLSHAFSEKALNAQEEILQSYVDKLIDAMRTSSASTGDKINLVSYYNWTTFDIIGDLLFGRSFDNLNDLRTHSHIENLLGMIEHFSTGYIYAHFPVTKWLGGLLFSKKNAQAQQDFWKFVREQTQQRIEKDTKRPDFMTFILQHNADKDGALSDAEIYSNAFLLIVAGSETTATLLSGVTWLLLKNPDVMQKLKDELRSEFANYEDITLASVSRSRYLLAVLDEALRYYPPVPTGFPRVIAKGGEMVSGYYMPSGTSVCVSSFAAHHDSSNFTDPDNFDPERWLGNEKYANDMRHEMQPFSFGPHACLGKNLAYGEMRLILAKVVWSFDLEMDGSAANWLDDCKVYNLWMKPPLPVHVSEAQTRG